MLKQKADLPRAVSHRRNSGVTSLSNDRDL
jgi:hypothetical protein